MKKISLLILQRRKAYDHQWEIPRIWLDFISDHVSAKFLLSSWRFFAPRLKVITPSFQNVIRLTNPGVGIRLTLRPIINTLARFGEYHW